jgi:PAS domain S-box-containing protein
MTQVNIVIVEDEPIVAMDIKRCLKQLGYQVAAVAANSEDAVQQIVDKRPDLVLMDIRLKGDIDGIETAWRIRQRFNVPIVYLTAHSDPETLERAKFTEPYGYILKPYEDRDLHTTIEMAIHRFHKVTEIVDNERSLQMILRSIGDAVIATDSYGYVTYMNAVAEAITGLRRSDAVGRKMCDVLTFNHEDGRIAANHVIEQVLRDGTVASLGKHNFVTDSRSDSGQDDSTVRPLRDADGYINGAVLIIQCREKIPNRTFVEDEINKFQGSENIHFTQYIQNLLANLLVSYGIHDGSLAVNLDIDENIRLEVETAYSCGLIINELVVISLKNAFEDNPRGEITISFKAQNGYYTLAVYDDGRPYGDDWDSSNIETFGMRIVYSIAEQLGGNVEHSSEPRNEFEIKFPQKHG